MAFQDLITAAQKYFPSLRIQYKDRSVLMKILNFLLFFNKGFMTDYTTTLGSTVYIPNDHYVKFRPVSGAVVLLHELVHMYDQKKIGSPWFELACLMPQVLIIPALLLFLLTWKIALPVILLLALPIPAYFRMHFEKRAYLSSLYVIQKLSEKLNFNPRLESQSVHFIECFIDSSYYFMWPFGNKVAKDFDAAIKLIQNGQRPYQDPVFDMLDDLINKV